MTIINGEIKPCPFCGETDVYWDEQTLPGEPVLLFLSCPCGAEGPTASNYHDAGVAWNTRVSS